MSNTHNRTQHFLRSVTAAFLLWGIVMITASSAQIVSASISATGQGSSVVGTDAIAAGAVATIAAPGDLVVLSQPSYAELRLVIGMLLVLAGLAFHMLSVLRANRRPQKRRASRFTSVIHRAFRARLL